MKKGPKQQQYKIMNNTGRMSQMHEGAGILKPGKISEIQRTNGETYRHADIMLYHKPSFCKFHPKKNPLFL